MVLGGTGWIMLEGLMMTGNLKEEADALGMIFKFFFDLVLLR